MMPFVVFNTSMVLGLAAVVVGVTRVTNWGYGALAGGVLVIVLTFALRPRGP